jgi:tetratricopeptide (TPR) repeat protein
MPYCISCGGLASDGAKFCTKCGRPFETDARTSNGTEEGGKRAWFQERLRNLESYATCAYCRHRRAKNVCGSLQSPHYGDTIKHEDCCEFFLNNPAQLHYVRALFMDEFAEKFELDLLEAIAEFRQAIQNGLPPDDEAKARLCVGKLLYTRIRRLDLEFPEWIALAESQEAINEMEGALALDREGRYGFFAEPKNRYQLRHLDMLYCVKGGILSIEKSKGDSISDVAALEYWEKKLPLCGYLPSSPLLRTLQEAGRSYSRLGKKEQAMQCFLSILTAAPVDPFDESGAEVELRQTAKASLEFLDKQGDSGD